MEFPGRIDGGYASLQEFDVVPKQPNHLKRIYAEEMEQKNPKIGELNQKIEKLNKKKEETRFPLWTEFRLKKGQKKLHKLQQRMSSATLCDSVGSPPVQGHHKINKLVETELLKTGYVTFPLYEEMEKGTSITEHGRYIWNNKGELFLNLLENMPRTELVTGRSVGAAPYVCLYNNYGLTPDKGTLVEREGMVTFKYQRQEYNLPREQAFVKDGQVFSADLTMINCDVVKVSYGKERTCSWAFADGCNWGKHSHTSATRATEAAISYIEQYMAARESVTLRSVVKAHINAFFEAHEVHVREGLSGQATLTLVTIIDGYLVVSSVGDSSVVVFRQGREPLINLTRGNRQSSQDATDPGGRVGLYVPLDNEQTRFASDLRNWRTSIYKLAGGDVVTTLSDGIIDCFDPSMRGRTPYSYGVLQPTWDPRNHEQAEMINQETMIGLFQAAGQGFPLEDRCANVIQTISALVAPSQLWLLTHPGQKLPADTAEYPGKLDHAGSVWFRYEPALYNRRSLTT